MRYISRLARGAWAHEERNTRRGTQGGIEPHREPSSSAIDQNVAVTGDRLCSVSKGRVDGCPARREVYTRERL